MSKIAKLFMTGGSQAVRLPAEFRFEGTEVHIRRHELTGDVILSATPRSPWSEFMALLDELGPAPDDFLKDRQQSMESRDPFDGWQE